MNRLKMLDLGASWEGLRKQACQLENELDLKLVSFSKLGTSYSSLREYGSSVSDSVGLPNKSSASHVFDNMSLDIQQLLASLTKVNEQLAQFGGSASSAPQNATLIHTLQRHWDILQDYSHEFQKIKANISAYREREDLLGSVHIVIYAYKSQTDLYLSEHEHLLSSERLVDEHISLAMSTKENLQSQKGALYTVSHKLNSLANRFPMINSLMQRINLRKRRDAIILASLIAACVIALLWYAIH